MDEKVGGQRAAQADAAQGLSRARPELKLLLVEIEAAVAQVRRLGQAYRDHRRFGSEGSAAEFSALHHLAEAKAHVRALERVEG